MTMTPGIGSATSPQGCCWSRRCVAELPRIVGRCRASLVGLDSDSDQGVDEAVGVAEVVGGADAKENPETKEEEAGGAPCYRGGSKGDRNLGRDP